MPLVDDTQVDFGVGIERDVAPHLIDRRGFYDCFNGLLDDDGSVYKRGGSVAKNGTALAAGRFLYEGYFAVGRRTFFATTSKWRGLAADDTTVLDFGGSGTPEPVSAAQVAGILFLGGGKMYAGSRKTANYSAGTVALTNGGTTVVGTGTAFTANVDAGMFFRRSGERAYVVASVTDDTHLVLAEPYEGATAGGLAYTLKQLETASSPYVTADIYGAVENRLVYADKDTIRVSDVGKPHSFPANNFLRIGEGARVLGMASLGADLIVFATDGVWVIQGLDFEIVDALGSPNWRMDHVSRDLVLWGQAGISWHRGSLIVPALDGIYIVDGRSAPVKISRSLERFWPAYVELGYQPGVATAYRGYYLMPVLDATGGWKDAIACRLDRPVASRGGQTYWPFTRLKGAGAKCAAFATRVGEAEDQPPQLVAVSEDGYVLNVTNYFEPDAGNRHDHDGTAPEFLLTLRDFGADELTTSRFRRAELLYELFAATGEDPRILLEVASGSREIVGPLWDEVLWDEFLWAGSETSTDWELLDGCAFADPGRNAKTWPMARFDRFVRFRIRLSDPAAKLTIRAFGVYFVPSGSRRRSRVSAAA